MFRLRLPGPAQDPPIAGHGLITGAAALCGEAPPLVPFPPEPALVGTLASERADHTDSGWPMHLRFIEVAPPDQPTRRFEIHATYRFFTHEIRAVAWAEAGREAEEQLCHLLSRLYAATPDMEDAEPAALCQLWL
jgi:hypothetical protein